MNYDQGFLRYVEELASIPIEEARSLANEALEYTSGAQRSTDAALIVMLVCRRFRTHEERLDLLTRLSSLSCWATLLHVPFFAAWLRSVDFMPPGGPGMGYRETEARWTETENCGEEGLFSVCKTAFADLGAWLDGERHHNFGGMNLMYFLNRSRRCDGLARIYNASTFGLQFVEPDSSGEETTILGRVQRGDLRVKSVRLGTSEPAEEESNVLD